MYIPRIEKSSRRRRSIYIHNSPICARIYQSPAVTDINCRKIVWIRPCYRGEWLTREVMSIRSISVMLFGGKASLTKHTFFVSLTPNISPTPFFYIFILWMVDLYSKKYGSYFFIFRKYSYSDLLYVKRQYIKIAYENYMDFFKYSSLFCPLSLHVVIIIGWSECP